MVFVSDRTGAKEIHVMDSDGGNVRRATSHKSINTFPCWAPDGNTIVYTSYRYANRPTLFLLTRGTRSPGRILRELDGAQIYAACSTRAATASRRARGGGWERDLHREARGGGVTRLTNNGAIDVGPTWSPDGTRSPSCRTAPARPRST